MIVEALVLTETGNLFIKSFFDRTVSPTYFCLCDLVIKRGLFYANLGKRMGTAKLKIKYLV